MFPAAGKVLPPFFSTQNAYPFVQERVNKCSSPDFSPLKRPAYKSGHWLASGNLGFGRAPPIPRTGQSGSLCPYGADNMVSAEHLLPFWESGILVHGGQRVFRWPVPNKNPRC